MKHLLILLSLLLLSSPLIGDNHKGETLYLWETSSGWVWKGFGEKETHPKYEGDVENGKPNGVGFLTSPNGGKYIGVWKDGFVNGQGTYIYGIGKLKGEKYEGEWKNGERTGPGTYTWSNGDKYVGEYKDEKTWNGTYYDKDGNIKGKYVNGVKQ